MVAASPQELRPDEQGVIDVFAALQRQFFWADTVIVGPPVTGLEADSEILEGEIVL
jgi:hypothetical protein